MLEIKGQYNTAILYTDQIDDASRAQIQLLLNQPFTAGSRIRMMPDVHAGAGCTIGTTMTIRDKIVPNLVGVDIGCGMETVKIRETHVELQKQDRLIHQQIPAGFSVRNAPHRYAQRIDLEKLRCKKHVNLQRGLQSIGTLGGGNHFIEADRDENDAIYLVVHSGSRHLGLEAAQYYQNAAFQALNGSDEAGQQRLIAALKEQGKEKEIQRALKALKKEINTAIPRELCYLEGSLFDDYIHDMRILQQYAALNREAMMDEILKGLGLHAQERFSTIHNYIDTDQMILRKGAVSAKTDEKLLIPINMRDGSLICKGLGNDEWNQSAPHGAGRLMSRSKARQTFTLTQFKAEMSAVYSTTVSRDTLDECPMAYKRMEDIIRHIAPTAEIQSIIRPLYNFKAGEED